MSSVATAQPVRKYTATAMSLHWLIAALIIGTFSLGWVMTDIPGLTPTKLRYFSWHKWAGVTVLMLVLIRLIWRATHAAPPLPDGIHGLERVAAHLGHLALYLLMLAIPISGYFYSSAAGVQVVYLGVVPLPTLIDPNPALRDILKPTHITLNYILLAMVIIHVLAVIKHELIDHKRILSRMLPGRH
jgi:cytochrome b561